MSDTSLGELERRWHETGSAKDEAACLLERVLIGTLKGGSLDMAAHLGHEAALVARESEPPRVDGDLKAWLETLEKWGHPAAVRAAIAAARQVLAAVGSAIEREPRHADNPLTTLEAAERWVLCPCPTHRNEATRAASEADIASRSEGRAYPGSTATGVWEAAKACAVLAGAIEPFDGNPSHSAWWGPLEAETVSQVRMTEAEFVEWGRHPPGSAKQAEIQERVRVRSRALIRDTIRKELVPWVLGYGDPVRERLKTGPAHGNQ